MTGRDHFRALARKPVDIPATVSLPGSRTQEERPAKVVDLGLGGACVEVSEPIAPALEVRLSLVMPHLWDPLRIYGHVAWSRSAQGRAQARVGIRFDGPTASTLRALVELLDAQAYD